MPGEYLPRTWQHDPAAYGPAKYRRACKYEAFLPVLLGKFPPLALDGPLAGLISEAEAGIGGLNAVAAPGLAALARLLLRSESIASSKIEGMQMGVRELARAEARADAGEKVAPTAIEILANVDAMQTAVDEAALAPRFTIDRITEIHRRLLERTTQAHVAGRLRTAQNWIGGNDYNPCGADFVPPPPEHLPALLTDLCAAIEDDLLPPVVQAALVHAQFETIHPFDDGNGRTGRALIHVVFRRRGLAPSYVPPISVYLAKQRDRYVAGLTGFRGDDVSKWIELFASVTAGAAKLAATHLLEVERLKESWRSQLSSLTAPPRAGSAAWAVIDVLPAHPVISGPIAAAATGRSRPQTYQALDRLEQAAVLVPITKGKRNRTWEATGLLDLIARLEAGE